MSYLSNIEYGSSEAALGCGPECSCGPCKAGLHGLDEWYVKEPERRPEPQASPPASDAQPLSGWERTGPAGYRGQYRRPPVGPTPAIPPDIDQRVVQDALRRGVRNLRHLTAMIFFARHPSRRAEWMEIRDRIARPALQQVAPGNGGFVGRGGVR